MPGTENLNGYFNAYTPQGTWTVGSGPNPLSSNYGYSSAVAVTQMSGSVSGKLGQTLSGSMTFIGSLLNGTSFSYAGPVSIDNSGGTVFNYTGTWAGFPSGTSSLSSGTASGTINQWPGYYFKQTMGTSAANYTLASPPLWNDQPNLNPSTGLYYNGTLSLSGTGGRVFGVSSLGGFSSLFLPSAWRLPPRRA
jgi:hypothetical protein